MTPTYLLMGGLVAAGFDRSGEYLLTISHSGRGLFSTSSWKRVARDYEMAYPDQGIGIGIGPIDGEAVEVTEMDYDLGRFQLTSASGDIRLNCESCGISVICL